MTQPDPRPRYWLRFAIGMGGYVLLVVLQSTFLKGEQAPLYLLIPLALLPLVPAVYGMLYWLRAVRTFDELQQRVQSEAGLFALGMTALATFSYGFLEAYAGFPKLSMFIVFPLIALTYLIGTARAQLRYR